VDDETFVFGSCRLIPAQRMLLDDGKPLRLGSRALDILIALVESAGKTVHKDRLIARTWPDMVVDEGALRVHVAALRMALGDGRAGRRYIANNRPGLHLCRSGGARALALGACHTGWRDRSQQSARASHSHRWPG
jgi:DNA-binding winged helix-turn-helix (wHTH) protein